MYIILQAACCSHSLTHNTSGDSMKVASNSDRVTSMLAPTVSESAYQSRINHQSTGQSVDTSSRLAAALHRGQNKAPARHRFPRARALSLTHTHHYCLALSRLAKHRVENKKRINFKKRLISPPTRGHTHTGVVSSGSEQKQSVNLAAEGTTLDPNFAGQLRALPRIHDSNRKAAEPP